MKAKTLKKLISILLTCLLILSSAGFNSYAAQTEKEQKSTTLATGREQSASKQNQTTQPPFTEEEYIETTEPSKTVEEAQKSLEQQLRELEEKQLKTEKKLEAYEESAKETAEYIDDLDEQIGYINEELNVLDKQISKARKKINKLNAQIKPLEAQIQVLEKAYNEAVEEFDKLNDEFNSTYEAYCMRLRAMYISGGTSILAALLTSKDISQFINRIEMIRAISKSDTKLLQEVNSKMELIITEQNGLNEQKAELVSAHSELDAKKQEYKKEQNKIESSQKKVASKKVKLSEMRAKSDKLFAKYTAKTQMYTEFRNEDEALVKSVEDEINALLSGLKSPDEVTTAADAEHNPDAVEGKDSEESSLYSKSNAVLNLTYPAPGHYSVSQSFGHYRNGRAHTGIDFPLKTGSKVVAAQKGIVVKVKRLNYSYGYYVMIYHGTDAKGRKIVTLYAHNSSILVSVGQTVKKGEQIAKGGSTGNSTGPHCHFELIIGGTKVNPKNYLSK